MFKFFSSSSTVPKVTDLRSSGLRSLPELIMFVTDVIFIDIRYSWNMHNIWSIVNNNKSHDKKYNKWYMKQPIRKIPSTRLNEFDWFLSMRKILTWTPLNAKSTSCINWLVLVLFLNACLLSSATYGSSLMTPLGFNDILQTPAHFS